MERLEQIAVRKAEIKTLLESEEEVNLEEIRKELDELEIEEKSINEAIETEQRKADEEAETRKEIAQKIEEKQVSAKEIELKGNEINMEVRNTPEYIDAFARYLKTEKDEEVRALLTTNAEEGGTIAVPDLVYDVVKTAWDREEIMRLVTETEIKGNLKVQFEISGDDAIVHAEGDGAITPEVLTEGIVTLIPQSIKKMLEISDEVYDMRGEAFLRYVYDELTYRIAKKCADLLISLIANLPATATATSPSANVVTSAPAMDVVAQAIGNLSDEATNPVIIMNKLTWSAFKQIQYQNHYAVDPFENLPVHFNNSLPAFATASNDQVYMIVGDLGHGAMANYPNGKDIKMKFDDNTKKDEDLIQILGRRYVGLGVVADKSFTLVKKASV